MPKAEHTFRSDISYTSLPLITTGIILRHERKNFRDARNKFQYNFHHTTDNYTQYAPLLLATGLKIAGYEGRSSWGRYLTSTAASYAVMGALVNGMKYSLKEQRPDGSTYNSFPSGHTATAFAAATILHKEYGLTRTPWISVAGYGLATMTGVMRVLNNRHWISDTFAG
ncbi:MAG: phosphatase PAP2 family protein, partial [Phocaeicola sp.]|uniref:phosphatase PAP2 family protein n=1 Tax=Phocaeicola sp. TaxID=2773926 RepID=UPI003F9EE828